MRGLYLHIPFCDKKCHYCNFVITTKQSGEDRKRFISAIAKEAEYAANKYGRLSFDTLYLGGGTPSVLSPTEIEQILRFVKKYFDVANGAEVSCEVNPGDGDFEKFAQYRDLGINRISLGVQSMEDSILQDMNRTHSADDIIKTFGLLKAAGFSNISVDLMTRLPGQSVKLFCDSLDRCLSLQPTQISLYDLEVHESTVFGLRKKRGELVLPVEDDHVAMMNYAEDRLDQAGFNHYEVLNFAKPGFESKHNLVYWKNREYLGLGPGAFSYLQKKRYQFADTVKRYYEKMDVGDWQNDQQDQLDAEKIEWENLIASIRLADGVDLDQFPLIRNKINQKIENLFESGVIEWNQSRVKLTRRGRFLIETVLAELVAA